MVVSARGLEFDVRIAGPVDGRPVLLLHGFPQHSGMWDGIVPLLHEAGLRTFAPDQRGYSPGARPSDVDSYTMPDFVADAVALLDALELDRVDVVGHDWGSVIGWHLAANHADRLRSFTAISVPHPEAVSRAMRTDPEQRERSAYMKLFAIPGRAEEVLLEDNARRLRRLFSPLAAEQIESYVDPLLVPGALTGALNWYRRLTRPEVGPAQVPVTFVWGSHDPAIGRTAALECAAFVVPELPFRFVELAGASHWLPDQVPATVAAEIIARVRGELPGSG